MRRFLAALVAVVVALAPLSSEAGPASPTERLRSFFASATRAIEDPRAEITVEDRFRAIRALVRDIFDFREAARLSLGPEWTARTPAERAEFVGLFADILERSFIGGIAARIRLVDGVQVSFIDESIEGGQATVRTAVAAKGGELPLHYRMIERGQRWAVRDVVIDGVSIAANYRAQFGRIMQGSSYAELVRQLRERVPGTSMFPSIASAETASLPQSALPETPAAPVVDVLRPTVEAPRPTVEAPRPVVEAPRPTVEAPRPAVEAPRPAVEAPRPAVEAPRVARETPRPIVGTSRPVVETLRPVFEASRRAVEAYRPVVVDAAPVVPALVAIADAAPREITVARAVAAPVAAPTQLPLMQQEPAPVEAEVESDAEPDAATADPGPEPVAEAASVSETPRSSESAASPARLVPPAPPATPRALRAKAYWVQVGAFTSLEAAKRLALSLREQAPALPPNRWVIFIEPTDTGAELAKVRVGPFGARVDATPTLRDVQSRGYQPFIAEEHD